MRIAARRNRKRQRGRDAQTARETDNERDRDRERDRERIFSYLESTAEMRIAAGRERESVAERG